MGAGEQELALAGVASEGCGAGEFGLGVGEAAELEKKIAADAGQEMVGPERRFGSERVEKFETDGWTKGHGECDGAIQLHDGRRLNLRERFIERDDTWPVGFFWRARTCVTSGDGSLKGIGARWVAEFLGAFKRG